MKTNGKNQPNTPNINKCLSHIFGKYYLDFGLDWIQLLIQKPNQKLPALCLYAEEKGRCAGRSILGFFLQDILESKSIFLLGNEFKSEFLYNKYINKSLAVVENYSMDNQERMRVNFIVSNRSNVVCQKKGKSAFYKECKVRLLLIMSNVVTIPSGVCKRIWNISVPTLRQRDPDLLEKMKAEIPDFLKFLEKRKLTTESTCQTWFHPDLLQHYDDLPF